MDIFCKKKNKYFIIANKCELFLLFFGLDDVLILLLLVVIFFFFVVVGAFFCYVIINICVFFIKAMFVYFF